MEMGSSREPDHAGQAEMLRTIAIVNSAFYLAIVIPLSVVVAIVFSLSTALLIAIISLFIIPSYI